MQWDLKPSPARPASQRFELAALLPSSVPLLSSPRLDGPPAARLLPRPASLLFSLPDSSSLHSSLSSLTLSSILDIPTSTPDDPAKTPPTSTPHRIPIADIPPQRPRAPCRRQHSKTARTSEWTPSVSLPASLLTYRPTSPYRLSSTLPVLVLAASHDPSSHRKTHEHVPGRAQSALPVRPGDFLFREPSLTCAFRSTSTRPTFHSLALLPSSHATPCSGVPF